MKGIAFMEAMTRRLSWHRMPTDAKVTLQDDSDWLSTTDQTT